VRRDPGFTLIEVVVALTIAVLVGGLLLQVFSQSLRGVDATARTIQATALAESLLAGIGADTPVAEGERSGETEQGLRWRLALAPLPTEDDAILPIALYEAEATVAWGAPPNVRSVTLRTVKIDKAK
jgi:prepilin-type N-terminal cleavage/methylation domain-containing protein